MKSLCSLFLCSLSVVFILLEPAFGISKDKDISSCDCSIYRPKVINKVPNFKLTRVYSTSLKPTKWTTTSYTTYLTRPETVTPIYLSKVSFLMLPSSSTTTRHRLTKDSGKTTSPTSSTSIRSTTSSTTPTTTFWSSSTTPSSYTVATFSTSPTPTSHSSFAYSKVTSFSMTSSSRVMWTRMLSSSSRQTREYTSTTGNMRLTTTTMKSLSSHRNELNDKKDTFSDKCEEYCRSTNTNSLANGESVDKYRKIVIDEVSVAIDLTVTVTAEYSPELSKPASAVYKSVTTHLSHLLVTMYNSTTGFQGVTIRKLRKGSIICDYTISVILKGNASVSDSVLESLYNMDWEHAYLPEAIGIIDASSTRNVQGRQLKVVAQQFKDICSLMEHECSRKERICINDQQEGLAICVFPCSSSQRKALKMSCLDGKCFLDDSGNPKCFCGAGHTCQKISGMPALYVLSAVGVGMVMMLSLLIGLTIYLHYKHRFKSDSRFQTQPDRRDIQEIVIEELKATNFHTRKH